MSNCGLESLKQMAELKSVSMFTLIHLAKDNGINLYFCKADPEQFMQVSRPAIFHQKNHFVFVENGESMPAGEYSGYVLAPKPINEPLSHSLARRIRGQKKASSFLGPILTGVASIVNPMLGAAVGAGFAGYQASKAPGGLGKNWWQIPLGGATGYLQGVSGGTTFGMNNAMLAGGLAAAGKIPEAIKTGNWMAPIGAGIGQYMGAQAIGGAQSGLSAAQAAGQGIFGQIGGAAKGAIGAFTGGGTQGTPGVKAAGGGVEIAGKGVLGSTPAGYGGSYTVPGIGNQVVGLPGGGGPAGFSSGAFGFAGGAAAPSAAMTAPASGALSGTLSKLLPGMGNQSGMSWLGQAASALLPPPKAPSMSDSYSKAARYLGNDNWNALPTATREQLNKYSNMSINDLSTEFSQGNDKAINDLERQRQQAIDGLMTSYANYGQDPYTSTDAQQKLTEINRQYDQAKAEIIQQGQNQAMNQAIDFKKQILQQSIQQNQLDYQSFMELAQLHGMDEQARYAMESRNYEAMQEVLARIFTR
jgi:hypothetical protein